MKRKIVVVSVSCQPESEFGLLKEAISKMGKVGTNFDCRHIALNHNPGCVDINGICHTVKSEKPTVVLLHEQRGGALVVDIDGIVGKLSKECKYMIVSSLKHTRDLLSPENQGKVNANVYGGARVLRAALSLVHAKESGYKKEKIEELHRDFERKTDVLRGILWMCGLVTAYP